MIQQTSIFSYSPKINRNSPTLHDKKESSNTLQVGDKNMIFCPRCNFYVGATFMGSFWKCSRRGHEIKSKKEVQ